jgi:hypothetical protein
MSFVTEIQVSLNKYHLVFHMHEHIFNVTIRGFNDRKFDMIGVSPYPTWSEFKEKKVPAPALMYAILTNTKNLHVANMGRSVIIDVSTFGKSNVGEMLKTTHRPICHSIQLLIYQL